MKSLFDKADEDDRFYEEKKSLSKAKENLKAGSKRIVSNDFNFGEVRTQKKIAGRGWSYFGAKK
jgi:hypothetical protein